MNFFEICKINFISLQYFNYYNMTNDLSLLDKLKNLLHWKKSKKFYAEKLNITEEEVSDLIKEIRTSEKDEDDFFTKVNESYLESVKKVNLEKGTVESTLVTNYEPKDHLELAKLHKINLDEYIITNYWSKMLPSGKFTSSIFSKRKGPADYNAEDFSKFLKNYKPSKVEINKTKLDANKSTIDVELSISDYHLAKKYIEGNNSIEKRARTFVEMTEELIIKTARVYNIDTVIFPISNDFFHTDNYQNQTTNGTPQDVIMEYDSEYELGFSILIDSINIQRTYSNKVIVVLVPGNHDKTKSFYLAHALEIYFKDDKDVEFLRDSTPIKALTLGNTFIGYHHGNCKIESLPLLFATHPIYGKMFGDSKYQEIHTGDKHHYMAKEIKGCRIQQMPSLSDSDKWHRDSGYVHSIRAALLLGYNKEKGKVCEFEKRI